MQSIRTRCRRVGGGFVVYQGQDAETRLRLGPEPQSYVPFGEVISEGAPSMIVMLTRHFTDAVRKRRLEQGTPLWKALLNLRYGYDPKRANSAGGRDGIFDVSEKFKPKNEMVVKLYDRYLHTDKGRTDLVQYLGTPLGEDQGVRVVSHGLRLLGFLKRQPNRKDFLLALTDFDIQQH